MGGIGSGLSTARATVEACMSIRVRDVFQHRAGRAAWSGKLAFVNRIGGRDLGSAGAVAFFAEVEGDRGRLLLVHDMQRRERRCDVALWGRPQPFGGLLWFFECPTTGDAVRTLHKPPRRPWFASRVAHGLSYGVQRQSARDRRTTRLLRFRQKLGPAEDLGQPFPAKPKWMRWATYERLRARDGIEQAAQLAAFAEAMRGRLGALGLADPGH